MRLDINIIIAMKRHWMWNFLENYFFLLIVIAKCYFPSNYQVQGQIIYQRTNNLFLDRYANLSKHIWAASWQNQRNGRCAQRRSDQPGHPPSLIRVFAVCMKEAWVLSYPFSTRRWSDWADAQAHLSLCWAHMPFCWFCHEAAHLWVSEHNFYMLLFIQAKLRTTAPHENT